MPAPTPVPDALDVVFHFDPICPWTWLTSRWLTEVAGARSLTLGFRSLSLRIVNDVPPGKHEALDAGFAALRVVEALAAAGDHARAAALYTALGDEVHRGKRPLDRALLAEVLAASGLPAAITTAADDAGWDAAVADATRTAVEAGGGGIGSPVIRWPVTGRATSGPIVSPPPTGDDALRLWDAVCTAIEIPNFYELKRGRVDVRPQIP
jgi:hypothetical protein